jgi:integrase
VGRFVAQRGPRGMGDLDAAEVSTAVLAEVAGWSPATARRYGCALRAFLRYCHLAGLIERDLSAAVLPVSGRRRSLLPQAISQTQAKALLRACDRRRAIGRRDYAVIVLLLRLGLRAGDVAALRLDDIDWRAGWHGHERPCLLDQRRRSIVLVESVDEGASMLQDGTLVDVSLVGDLAGVDGGRLGQQHEAPDRVGGRLGIA